MKSAGKTMNNIIKPTIILTIVAFASAFALSHIKQITYPNILQQEKSKKESALSVVMPGYKIGAEQKSVQNGKEFVYWTGEKTENSKVLKAWAFITESPGYSGPVISMVGVDESLQIIGISILQQTETPGLGARAVEVASKETFFGVISNLFSGSSSSSDPGLLWFQEQFRGLSIAKKINIVKRGDWTPEMKKDLLAQNAISAITGATVTSRTVTKSLEDGLVILKKILPPQPILEKKEEVKK